MSGPKATTSKQSTKMHRRSRSGCFTCRLRRKKCDEGKPMCKACRCLGLKCEYRRPMWWSNTEQRRQQKETIKMIIKRTKMQEKAVQMASKTAGTPPGLSHSIPTSDTHSDATLHRQRSVSLDSQFSLEYDFNAGAGLENFSGVYAPHRHPALYPEPLHSFSPYEVDVKTERQMFVNDVPTRRDSSISTFSTFQPPPPPHSILPSFPLDSWTHDDYFTSRREPFFGDEEIPPGFFDFGFGHPVQTQQAMVQVEECDRRLLDHFIDNVLRLIFPFLEVNQHGSARDVILPALESNKCYLHCCLSISALHLKATREAQGEDIDNDIVKHRFATVSELCDALTLDTNHMQILEATLGMIFFHCSVGRADDCLPDIPWHSHFQAASSLVHKLELPQAMADIDTTHAQPPFNMTLTSWIDILGATMMGRTPLFANTYREKIINNSTSGLCELMGCEDRIMYLISEIACLEALKLEGMDDFQICNHVHALADQIGLTEPGPGALALPYSSTGAIRPRQLSKNLTAMFRLAARIYLCSLVPGFDHQAVATSQLVTSFADTMVYIPSGPNGFDRLLVWPYLIAGGASTPSSSFRRMFTERVDALGEHAEFGSFGRMVCLLREVWRQAEERGIYAPSFSGAYPTPTSATTTQQQQSQTQQAPYQPDCVTAAATAEPQNVHWRDVMQQKGWDFLLI